VSIEFVLKKRRERGETGDQEEERVSSLFLVEGDVII
jgi:hypothetical protein